MHWKLIPRKFFNPQIFHHCAQLYGNVTCSTLFNNCEKYILCRVVCIGMVQVPVLPVGKQYTNVWHTISVAVQINGQTLKVVRRNEWKIENRLEPFKQKWCLVPKHPHLHEFCARYRNDSTMRKHQAWSTIVALEVNCNRFSMRIF